MIERDSEGYYVASVPQLPACHTQARSLDEVTECIREAIALRLEVEGAPEQDLEFIGIQRVNHRGMSRAPRVTGPELMRPSPKPGSRQKHPPGTIRMPISFSRRVRHEPAAVLRNSDVFLTTSNRGSFLLE